MTDFYPIIQIPDNAPELPEQQGTKTKYWLNNLRLKDRVQQDYGYNDLETSHLNSVKMSLTEYRRLKSAKRLLNSL